MPMGDIGRPAKLAAEDQSANPSKHICGLRFPQGARSSASRKSALIPQRQSKIAGALGYFPVQSTPILMPAARTDTKVSSWRQKRQRSMVSRPSWIFLTTMAF